EINLSIGSANGTTDYNKLSNKPSINGTTLEGNVSLSEIGLGNVDNTSDLNKPVSKATLAELELKANKFELEETNTRVEANSEELTDIKADIAELNTELETKVSNEDLKDVVKYKDFTYNNEQRKTIELENNNTISGKDTNGEGHNLIMLSKWNVADIGATGVHLNLNTVDNVTINDNKTVATEDQIENLVTKTELDEAIKSVNTSTFATKEELKSTIDNIQIPDVSNLATKTELNKAIANIPEVDLSGLATKTEVEEAVSEINLPTKVSELENDSNYTTLESVAKVGYLKEHQDISNLVTKEELTTVEKSIPNVSNLATKEELTQGLVNKVDTEDLAEVAISGLYSDLTGTPTIPTKTSQLTNDSGFLTEHQDISDLATNEELTEVENKIPTKVSQLVNDSDFLTSIPEEYVTATELEQTITSKNLATKTEVNSVSDELSQLSSQVGTQGENIINCLKISDIKKITTGNVLIVNTESATGLSSITPYVSNDPNTIAVRDNNGCLNCSNPQFAYDAVNKQYLEQKLATVVTSDEITKIKKLTQAEYDALTTKDENTWYVIIGE
ncbi:MAG: hypothetical protein NC222_06060, partial [Staphylococcus sp.]|nr:hypothetical protein [Staphylococcus sp.]